MKIDPKNPADLSAQIAKAIRDAIICGDLPVDERLPSEAELAEQFHVSRPTVREALKRLAAQSLIRTQRGATGGAFVNRLKFEDAYGQQIKIHIHRHDIHHPPGEHDCPKERQPQC